MASALRTSAQLCHDVVNGIADGLEIGQVFVFDAKANTALTQFLFEGLNQLNKGQAVGIEIIGEGIAFVDGGGLGLDSGRTLGR
jgi:hypothetical protein